MIRPQHEDDIKNRVREQFAASGNSYVTSKTHRDGPDLDRLVDVAELSPTVEALDIATGGGHTARAIAPHSHHVVVSDLTPAMLDTARAFLQEQGIYNVSFRIADAEALPFKDSMFDLVTCRIAPHHFPNVGSFVTEVARVLRPGGIFILIDSVVPEDRELDDFFNNVEWQRDRSHVRSLRKSTWEEFFASAGMDIELYEAFPKTHDFADWTARSRMSDDDRFALNEFMVNGSEAAKKTFQVTIQNNIVINFTDQKGLFKARRREQ